MGQREEAAKAKAKCEAAEAAAQQIDTRKKEIEMDRTKEVNKRLSVKVGELTAEVFEKTVALEKTAEATRSIILDRDRLENELRELRESIAERESAAKES